MTRTKTGKKAPGYEFLTKRPISRGHGAVPGRWTKTRTHRLERIEAKIQIKKEQDEKD